MKIFLIGRYNSSEVLNGPEKFAKRLFEYLNKSTNEVIFVEYFFKGGETSFTKRLFGKELVNPKLNVLRLGHFQIFLNILKQKPSIIHIVTFERFAGLIFLYKFLIKARLVVTHHSVFKYQMKYDLKSRSRKENVKDLLLQLIFLKLADLNVFVSSREVEVAKCYYSLNDLKLMIIPNGIDEEFQKVNSNIIKSSEVNILFYENFLNNYSRGFNTVYEVLNELGRVYKFKLYLLGNVDSCLYENSTFEILKITLLNKSLLLQLLSNIQIFLKSINFDSFSIFAIETMAAGVVPVVSSNVGMSSYIINNVNGFVYEKENIHELKSILQNILNGKTNLNAVSSEAKKIYYTLNWNNIAKQYNDSYRNA